MRVLVSIGLKSGVLDPQGKATHQALQGLGFQTVQQVRIGKEIILDIDGHDQKVVTDQVRQMCERILVNTVVEDYKIQILST